MDQKRYRTWIILLITTMILLSSSFITVNGSCFQTTGQDTFVARASQKEQLLSNDRQSFAQIVTEDGVRTLSPAGFASRLYAADKKEDKSNFNSIFAILFKVAVIPSFLIMGSLFQAERKGISFQRRILKFIHNIDGKK